MIKNEFGKENVLTYEVDIYDNPKTAYYGKQNWLKNKHYITIIAGKKRKDHRVFFDYIEIEPNNLKFGFQDESLAFEQRFGNMVLGLHMLMDHSGFAKGSILKGDKAYAASFKLLGARYTCKAGISETLVGSKPGGALYYDLSSADEWNAIPWLDNVLEFNYSIKPIGKIGKDPLYETTFHFYDNATKNEWTVKDNPIGTGECICNMEQKGKSKIFTMSMKTGKKAKRDDRSALSDPEKAIVSVFPDKFSFKFDESFYMGNGAFAVTDTEGLSHVYAIALKPSNPNIVGTYRFRDNHYIFVNRGKLIVEAV